MKNFSSYLRHIRSGTLQDPVRDWLIILSLATLAFVAIIVWNVWAFSTVAEGGSLGTTATSTTPVFDHSSIDAINTAFELRAAEDQKYVTGVYTYTDPSQ